MDGADGAVGHGACVEKKIAVLRVGVLQKGAEFVRRAVFVEWTVAPCAALNAGADFVMLVHIAREAALGAFRSRVAEILAGVFDGAFEVVFRRREILRSRGALLP